MQFYVPCAWSDNVYSGGRVSLVESLHDTLAHLGLHAFQEKNMRERLNSNTFVMVHCVR